MKYASDFRATARDALRGRWGIAVLAGFLHALICGGNGGGNSGGSSSNATFPEHSGGGFDVGSLFSGIPSGVIAFLSGAVVFAVILGIALLIGWTILSSVINTGYHRLNLRLVDREEATIDVMFSYFPHWKNLTVASLLQGLYIFLWSLLLVIPGIIACFSYAMTPFILAENPNMPASEAIEQSKLLMEGNRWRLFCLELSFIGWGILATLTLGIGNLWLRPYIQVSTAAFYREISGTARSYAPETF